MIQSHSQLNRFPFIVLWRERRGELYGGGNVEKLSFNEANADNPMFVCVCMSACKYSCKYVFLHARAGLYSFRRQGYNADAQFRVQDPSWRGLSLGVCGFQAMLYRVW